MYGCWVQAAELDAGLGEIVVMEDRIWHDLLLTTSVGEPDPDPLDPHVFGPYGSGSISEVWIWIRILPFCHKGVERTEIMLAKKKFLHKILSQS